MSLRTRSSSTGDEPAEQSRRPRGLRLFSLLMAAIGLANAGMGLQAIRLGAKYAALGVAFPPLIQAAAGWLWGAGFVAAAWALWNQRNGAARWVLLFVVAYALFNSVWWQVFVRADYARARWPFALLMLGLLVALTVWYTRRVER